MACEDTRQLTEAQRVAGYLQQRTGVQQAVRPFTGRPTLDNLLDYINRELVPAVRQTRNAVNDTYNQVRDNAPSGNPLQFYFSTETANADPTTGFIRLDAATQDTATTIRVSQTNGRLQDVGAWLDVMAGGATTPLGTITLFDAINPARFIRWDLNTIADQGAYWNLGVSVLESSHDNPFVEGGGVVIAFIPGVAGAGATVPPTAISPIGDDTFLANISGASAAPTAVALTTLAGAGLTGGANAVLAVGAGTGITVTADAVGLSDMAAGTVKGRQIDAGTGAPVDLTGAEQAENLRRATVQTESPSPGDVTIALNADTTVLLINTTGNTRVRAITHSNSSGREIAIEHVRTSGSGILTLENQSGVAGTGSDLLLPNNGDIYLGHRDGCVLRYRPSFWRLQSRAGQFLFRFPGQPIYDVMAPPYNAAGDGVTDDTAAINAAIDDANAEPGTIYLGAEHLVSGPLNAITGQTVAIRGRGERGDGTVVTATGATPFDVFTFSGSSTCYIERVHIVGPGTWASEGWGIVVDQCLRTRIIECRITGTYGAVHIYASIVTELWRTIATETLGPVGFYANGSAADGENHSLSFHSCATGDDVSGGTIAWYKHGSHAHTFTMSNCGALQGGIGLLVEDDSPGTGSRPLFTRTVNFQADHCAISGIQLKGGSAGRFTATFVTSTTSGPGIDIQSTYSGNWEICGGAVNSVGSHGISIAAGDGIVCGVQIGAVVSGSDCINVGASVADFNITGCSCGDMFAANSVARYGINIGAGCDNYAIVGNRCVGNTTGAINNTPGTSSTRVVANNVPQTTGTAGALQTVSGASGDITVTLNDDTGVLLIESTGNVRLQGLISDNLPGRELVIEHVRTSGSGVLTVQHQAGGPGGGIDFLLPNDANLVFGHRAGLIVRMRPNFWRLEATGAGVFGATRQGLVPVAGATGTNVLLASGAFGEVANAGLRDSAGLSVIGRSSNSTGDVADITGSAALQYFRVNSAGTALEWGTITLASLPTQAAGTVLGRTVDGGTGVPVALTGAELAENWRRATVQTVSGVSGDITVTLSDDTTVLVIESAGTNIRLQAITFNNASGRELIIEHVRTSGSAELTVQHQSGVGGGSVDFLCQNNADIVLGHRAALSIRYRPSFWRVQGAAMGVFTSEQQGLVPVSGATATNVLRADATWGTVALAGLADLAQSTIIGRAEGGGTGVPQALTPTQVVAIIDGESPTWTGAHTFNGASLTANVGTADVLLGANPGGIGLFSGQATANVTNGDLVLNSASGIAINASGTAVTSVATGAVEVTGTAIGLTSTGDTTIVAGGVLTLSATTQVQATSPFLANQFQANGLMQWNGIISPTISADQNNWSPTGLGAANVIRVTASGAARTITGIAGGASGRVLVIINVGTSFAVTLAGESASSTAANRIIALNEAEAEQLGLGHSSVLWYDSTSERWRIIARYP